MDKNKAIDRLDAIGDHLNAEVRAHHAYAIFAVGSICGWAIAAFAPPWVGFVLFGAVVAASGLMIWAEHHQSATLVKESEDVGKAKGQK